MPLDDIIEQSLVTILMIHTFVTFKLSKLIGQHCQYIETRVKVVYKVCNNPLAP